MTDLIVRSESPEVLECPFDAQKDFITPSHLFYVRNHFPEPTIDSESWSLKVEGQVKQPLSLSYSDILEMPAQTITATLECAGNSRTFLHPPPSGVKWGLGGISNASWTGICLATLLDKAGLTTDATEVILEGADAGTVNETPCPQGPIPFARSLPITKALSKEVLLAYQMNGNELSAKHGFPLRAIVPGWYAMSSVKWLKRIIVSNSPFGGYFQTIDYAYWNWQNGNPVRTPISEMLVKAEIACPQNKEIIGNNTNYSISGAAWSGESTIAKVELSLDNGLNWFETQLIGQPIRHAWCFWQYNWQVPAKPGKYILMARATDGDGNTQPMKHNANYGNYMINHCLPISVRVE